MMPTPNIPIEVPQQVPEPTLPQKPELPVPPTEPIQPAEPPERPATPEPQPKSFAY